MPPLGDSADAGRYWLDGTLATTRSGDRRRQRAVCLSAATGLVGTAVGVSSVADYRRDRIPVLRRGDAATTALR